MISIGERAIRAHDALGAIFTHNRTRKTTTIQEKYHLFAAIESKPNCIQELAGIDFPRAFPFHIYYIDIRQGAGARPDIHFGELIFAGLRVLPTFQ